MFIMNYIQQVCWSYYDVMGGQVVFFEIVAKNLGSRLPYDTELILLFSVLQPIKTHIHVSWAILEDGFIYDAFRHIIVWD